MNRVLAILALLCVPLPQTVPGAIHTQGKVVLNSYDPMDVDGDAMRETLVCMDCVDTLAPHTSFKGSDFMFQVVGKRQYFHPQHKARLATGIAAGMGYQGCAKATYVKGMVRIDNLPANTVVCVITNEGRYSEIKIEKFDPQMKRLSLSYTTWERENSSSIVNPPH